MQFYEQHTLCNALHFPPIAPYGKVIIPHYPHPKTLIRRLSSERMEVFLDGTTDLMCKPIDCISTKSGVSKYVLNDISFLYMNNLPIFNSCDISLHSYFKLR